jgi:hypothetical protein
MYYIFNMQISFHHIYLSNCAFNVSCRVRLIFESYLKYLESLNIGLVAKYIESRYNIVDAVFAFMYKHFIKQSPSS